MRSAALLLLCAALGADEVTLTDGTVIEGEVIDAGVPGVVSVRMGSEGMVAVRHLPQATVAKVVIGPTPRQRAAAALAADIKALGGGGDAAAWAALARRAREAGDGATCRRCALEAVERDRQHAEARRLLGQQLVNGVWMRADEAAIASGRVWHEGRWLTWAEREAALAATAERIESNRRRAEALAAARRAAADERVAAASALPGYSFYSGPLYPAYRTVYWAADPYFAPFGVATGQIVTSGVSAAGYTAARTCTPAAGGSLRVAGAGSNYAWGLNWRW